MFGIDDIIGVGMKILDKVIPDPAAKAEAQAKLVELQQQGRLAELAADTAEAQELTKRQESDMASDSCSSFWALYELLTAIIAGVVTGKTHLNL